MSDARRISKRRLLQIAGGTGIAALAGCSGTGNSSGSNSGGAKPLVVQDTVVSEDGGLGPGQADCQLTSQFYRGQLVVFRVKVIDPQTDDPMTNEDLGGVSIDIKSGGGQTIQTQYRKHGGDTFWIGLWSIPEDFPAGTVDYSIEVKGTQASVVQFAVPESQLKVLNKTVSQTQT